VADVMTALRIQSAPALALLALLFCGSLAASEPAHVDRFIKSHCLECHEGKDAEGKLDLAALSRDIKDRDIERRWVRIYDRVESGEMPPKGSPRPPQSEQAPFLEQLGARLITFRETSDREQGRVRGRRLTRREIASSLQDLLGIDTRLAGLLTEDAPSDQYSTVAEGQTISHFHLEDHLHAVDQGLDDAYRRVFEGDHVLKRDLSAEQVSRRDPNRRTREPEMREGLAAVWSSGLIFYGRIPSTTAPEDGWYHFNVRVKGLKLPKEGGVWTTVQSGRCVSSAPLLSWVTSFEATDEFKDIEFSAWLTKGDMLEIRPGDITLKRARFQGGQVGVGEGEPQDVPGIAIERITMERDYRIPREETQRLLFGDLEVRKSNDGKARLVAWNPSREAENLLTRFATRAFRRPVDKAVLKPYVDMVQRSLREGDDLATALRVGYRAILCSPRFLYFTEAPGELDDFALATRLSYFLTGTTPDEDLLKAAQAGKLKDKAVLREQVDRLLEGRGASMFAADFCDEWLDLQMIGFTEPDPKLYPGFDPIVQNAMLDETWATVETMIRENRNVAELIDADWTWLNSRLARFYGIDGVEGDELRQVKLDENSQRGGILTQGAVLKVTANGSTTSPVVRGVFVAQRLLGYDIPPPPSNVPAIEPDIRGSKSIGELLEKHRSQDMCASCHVKIDPPGFALENFDPSGRWRDRYLQMVDGRREKGPVVQAGYTLPDGRKFESLQEFRRLIAADPKRLAENLAEELLTYGTGAPVSFADRRVVKEIAEQASKDNYGFRSILYAVVESPTFRSK
jgi:hypothetical protein